MISGCLTAQTGQHEQSVLHQYSTKDRHGNVKDKATARFEDVLEALVLSFEERPGLKAVSGLRWCTDCELPVAQAARHRSCSTTLLRAS